jgi:hypothetical protein
MYHNNDNANQIVHCLKCLTDCFHCCWSRTLHAARCFAMPALRTVLAASKSPAAAVMKPTVAQTDIQAHAAIPLTVQASAASVSAAPQSSRTRWCIRLSLIPAFGRQLWMRRPRFQLLKQYVVIVLLPRLGRMTESMSVGQCVVFIARFCADSLSLNFRVLCCAVCAAHDEVVNI